MGSKQTTASRSAARKGTTSSAGRTGLGAKRAVPAAIDRPQQPIAPDDRRRMISEAAYFRAMRRGFGGGCEIQDWLEAEAEVDASLHSG